MVQHQAGLQRAQLDAQPILLQAAAGIAGRQAQRPPGRCGEHQRVDRADEAQAQRLGRVGRLGQRRRQLDRHALQIAGQLPFGVAGLQADQGLVGRLALQAVGQPGHQRAQLGRAAQALGAGIAGDGKAQRAVGLGAAVDLGLATGQLGAQGQHLEALLGGLDLAAGTRQQRQVGPQPHIVARQLQQRLDLRIGRMAERDVQRQAQLGRAGHRGLRQAVTGPAAHRGAVQVAQQVAGRAADLALHLQQGLRRQLADAALHLAQLQAPQPHAGLLELQGIALEHQLAADRGKGRPGRFPGRIAFTRRHRRDRRQRHVLQLAGQAELAVAPVHIGEVPQVALHAEDGIAHRATGDRPAHPVAGRLADAQRQVAGHPVGLQLVELAAQRQHPRQPAALAEAAARPGVPLGLQAAAAVGIVEAHAAERQLNARLGIAGGAAAAGLGHGRSDRGGRRRLDAPLQLGGEPGHRHRGLLEHARQLDRAVGQPQLGLAAGLGGLQAQVGAAPAGPADATGLGRRRCGDRQAADLGPRAVGAGRVQRPVPAGGQAAHGALGVELVEQRAQALADRQALGQIGQRGQVQPVGAELAAGHRVAGAHLGQAHGLLLAPARRQLAGQPALAVTGGEGQPVDGQGHAAGRALGHEAPAQLLKCQRLQGRRQAHRDVAHRGLQRQRQRQRLVPVDPGPQRGLAMLQADRQVHMLAQAVDIHLGQVGIQRALPALPVAGPRQQRAARQRAQRETLAPAGRRGGVQAELMPAPGVAHHQQHVVELQRRSTTQLVHPAQHAAADHQLVLLEQPVGRSAAIHRRIARGLGQVDIQPGHMPAALGVAPHLQARVLDQQLLEAQAQRQQGRHRQRRRHLRQAQCLAPTRIAQHHVLQHQGRHPAGALGGDAADLHRMPECAAGLCFQLRAPFVQPGQNQPMQAQPHRQGPDPQPQEEPEQQGQQ